MSKRMDWAAVKREHVAKALEFLTSRGSMREKVNLFVISQGRRFPAKEVLRIAYCFAKKEPPETKHKFSSGDGVLKLLRTLGFEADRAVERSRKTPS